MIFDKKKYMKYTEFNCVINNRKKLGIKNNDTKKY